VRLLLPSQSFGAANKTAKKQKGKKQPEQKGEPREAKKHGEKKNNHGVCFFPPASFVRSFGGS
jgi:hypothetical protein